jgi:hypothetical protein
MLLKNANREVLAQVVKNRRNVKSLIDVRHAFDALGIDFTVAAARKIVESRRPWERDTLKMSMHYYRWAADMFYLACRAAARPRCMDLYDKEDRREFVKITTLLGI